jgi:hypothetical protein
MFPAPPEYLQLAEQHLLKVEREIVLQRQRIARLRAVGADTSDAEALLSTFNNTLVVMQRHLHVETAGQAMQQRFGIARALARQKLEKLGAAATDEAIEREAALFRKGLFVKRPHEEIALTVRALIASRRAAQSPDSNIVNEDPS